VEHYDRLFGNAGYIARKIAADISGPAAIPRRNGEPVFNEPWESRIFGAAVALCERGLFEWDEFRERLIAEIAAADAQTPGSVPAPTAYYKHFLSAFERLLADKGVCAQTDIDQRISLESPERHDHD
jgi:nitrile hydratase accessory protein